MPRVITIKGASNRSECSPKQQKRTDKRKPEKRFKREQRLRIVKKSLATTQERQASEKALRQVIADAVTQERQSSKKDSQKITKETHFETFIYDINHNLSRKDQTRTRRVGKNRKVRA